MAGRVTVAATSTSGCPIIDPDVSAAENRPEPYKTSDASSEIRWGAYNCGLNLATTVCPTGQLAFEVEHRWKDIDRIRYHNTDQAPSHFTPGRVPKLILQSCPIDVLVADHSSDRDMDSIFGSDHNKTPEWMEWVRQCPSETRPSVIIQVWPSWSLTAEPGPAGKFPRKTLEGCGYDLRYQVVQASHYGSPVWQHRLVIIGFKHGSTSKQAWDFRPSPSASRSMSNCLRPFGAGETREHLPQGCGKFMGMVPDSATDPMPCKVNSWIRVPTGYRRLLNDELAKGLGIDSSVVEHPTRISARLLDDLVGVHLWEIVFATVDNLLSIRECER